MTVYDHAHELEEHLPAFLTQEYEPGYEVIVVDESSTDETDDVLKLQKQSYPHLYTTFLPKPNRNITRLKLALTIGVKAAKKDPFSVSAQNELILQLIQAGAVDPKLGIDLMTFEGKDELVKLMYRMH